MLTLNLSTENERELACSLAAANNSGVTDSMLEEVGAWMIQQALKVSGLEFQHSHRQSVGAFEIVQAGDSNERDAWASAISATRDRANAMLADAAKAACEAE